MPPQSLGHHHFESNDKMKPEAEENGTSEAMTLSRRELAFRYRYLMGLIVLTMVQYGCIGPSVLYVINSFFASWHGGGDCELTPNSDACRQGSTDAALYHGVTGAATHTVGWLCAVSMGSFSDLVGRKPLFQVKVIVSLVPTGLLALHIWTGVTLWLFLLSEPFYIAFNVQGVALACLTDLIPEKGSRATGFGLVISSMIVVGAMVLPFGAVLPKEVAAAIAVVAAILKVIYTFTIFPETCARATTNNAQMSWSALKSSVWRAVQLIARNRILAQMVAILALHFVAIGGISTIAVPYMSGYLGFNRIQMTSLWATVGIVGLLFLSVFLKPLTSRYGQVETMKTCLVVPILTPILMMLSSEPWHLFVVTSIVAGPSVLLIPIIAAVKSNLVSEDEQGLVQGVLAAMKVFTQGASDLAFGWFYYAVTARGTIRDRSAAFPPFFLVAALAVCARLCACGLPEPPSDPPRQGDDALELSAFNGSLD